MSSPHQTKEYRAWAKKVLATADPTCIRCGYPVDMDLPGTHPDGPSADHEPPIALTGDITPSLDGAGISHLSCNRSHGGRIGARRAAEKKAAAKRTPRKPPPRSAASKPRPKATRSSGGQTHTPAAPSPLPPDPAENGPVTAETTEDGLVRPRLETKAPERAVGSYGDRARDWLKANYGMELRGWQAYALDRALEHDADGDLVWPVVIVTVARQSGKSYLARGLCLWRLHEGRELFGGEQLVIHVANKRETAMEVLRPAGNWAVEKYGKKAAKWGNQNAGIEIPSGDRWIIHAANESAGVGYSVDMAFVDEAWKVKREVVDDALVPTMAERPSPQLYLVSTAGDSTSDLLIQYRQRALDRIDADDPGSILLLEWSAPQDADPDDVETWKWASPEWSDRRQSFLATQHGNVELESWRTQFLNQWVHRADSWLRDAIWDATLDDRPLPADRPWVVALESDFDGMGHAVAVAAVDDEDRAVIRVTTHRTIAECDARIEELRAEHHQLRVIATPTYIDRLRTPIEQLVGQREAAAATQTLLDAFERLVIAHDGSKVLREHFAMSTISKRQGGWTLTAPMGRAGVYAARAVMFAVWQASKVQKPAAAIHVRRKHA